MNLYEISDIAYINKIIEEKMLKVIVNNITRVTIVNGFLRPLLGTKYNIIYIINKIIVEMC